MESVTPLVGATLDLAEPETKIQEPFFQSGVSPNLTALDICGAVPTPQSQGGSLV
jgi:hypothetical protein